MAADVETISARDRLYLLLSAVQEGSLEIQDFCDQFETTFNLHVVKSALSEAERIVFSELFDKVIWYSPFPQERKEVVNYLGEGEIRAAAGAAIAKLAART